MAEGLGVAASVLCTATAAIQSVRLLSQTIDSLKGAPSTFMNVTDDLQAVELVLRQLHAALQDGELQLITHDEIEYAVVNCDRACENFRALLDRYMRHSTEGKTFWVDRWRLGVFGQERLNTFQKQLNDCKSTLNVALSTANILSTTRQKYFMKEMKDLMLRQNEAVVEREVARAERERTSMESSLQQLASRRNQSDDEWERNRRELLCEIEHQRSSNDSLRKMCEEALSRTRYERTGQRIKGVKATDNSVCLTGFIKTSEEECRIDQDISDVSADNRSFAVAGVVRAVDLEILRPTQAEPAVGRGRENP